MFVSRHASRKEASGIVPRMQTALIMIDNRGDTYRAASPATIGATVQAMK